VHVFIARQEGFCSIKGSGEFSAEGLRNMHYTLASIKEMKVIKAIVLLQLLICTLVQGNNYEEGDTLNVFAESGLNLRLDGSITSKKIGLIPFGATVIVTNTFKFDEIYHDEIENLKGNWVQVRFDSLQGFVFDGFLSKLRIPDYPINEEECSEGIGLIDTYLTKKYGLDRYFINYPASKFTIVDSVGEGGELAHDFYEEKVEGIGSYRFHRYYEGLGSEIIFKNIRESEVLNLARILIKRCKFPNPDIEVVDISKYNSQFYEYKNEKCCKSFYIYKKGDRISFMINFYT
jgi:hypothetical protein